MVQEGDYNQDEVVYAGFDKGYAYNPENFFYDQFSVSVAEFLDGKRIKYSYYDPNIEEWIKVKGGE